MGKSQKTLSLKVAQNGAELGVNKNLFNFVEKKAVDQLELNANKSGNSYS